MKLFKVLTNLTVIFSSVHAAPALRQVSEQKSHLPEDHDIWIRILQDNGSFPIPNTPPPARPPTRAPINPPRPPTSPPVSPPTSPPNGGSPSPQICGMPAQLRADLLTGMAEGISGSIVNGTPQARALEWLINEDGYTICPDDPKAYQRYILGVFYFTTEGDDWAECSAPDDFTDQRSIRRANDQCTVTTTEIDPRNPAFLETTEGTDAWLTPVYECEWAGIACRVEGNCVDRIEFEGNDLNGILPFELRDLGDLRFLILEQGTTAGKIPSEFGEMDNLLFLDLDFNRLTGTIPNEIYGLNGLSQLDLNNNFLTGTISTSIGNLNNLIFLQLAANEFTGEFPAEMAELTSLLSGSFEDTDLRGEFPAGLCDSLLTKQIYTLITDCNPDGPRDPKVNCSCCTSCFPTQ